MKIIYSYTTVLLLCILSFNASSQKSFKKQAEVLFEKENYHEALKTLNAYNKTDDDLDALYMRAVSYYYTNNAEKSIIDIAKLLKEQYYKTDLYWYLAKSFQSMGMYNEAMINFKNYLNLVTDESKHKAIINEIKRCEQSGKIQFLPQIAYIENFGDAVNTRYNEISPLQSLNIQNKFYFSSDREGNAGSQRNKKGEPDDLGGVYFYDMLAVELNNGNYTPTLNFNYEQNTSSHEILQDFNRDGSAMYYTRYSELGNMRILTDTFGTADLSEKLENKIELPLYLKDGDKDYRIINDSIIVFSSKRDGGYGGYDIYFAKKSNENWSQIVNAGPNINTVFDEVSPFLTKGGNTLLFSSNSLFGLGGFDIFASQYQQAKNTWSDKINLGLPINSPKDDLNAYITHDGTQLLLSSDRLGGAGGYDLYIAYLKEQLHDQLSYTEDLALFNITNDSISNETTQTEKPKEKTSNRNKSVIINSPLYYNNDESVLSPNNKIIIKNIKSLLEINPDIHVNIIAHSDFDPAVHQALFFNSKRAESVVDNFVINGIKANRFTVHSYGSSFPMVNDKGSRNNSRIEFVFDNYNKTIIEINDDLPVLNLDIINPAYQDYLMGKKSLIYKVRISTAKQMMRNDAFLSYPYFSVLKNMNNEYEYYCGYKTNYEEAKLLKLNLLSKGFTEATIVPFVNHTQVNLTTAPLYISNYIDIQNYIDQEK